MDIVDDARTEVEHLRIAHRSYRTSQEVKLYTYVIITFKEKLRCAQKIFEWGRKIPDVRSFPSGVIDHAVRFLDSWPARNINLSILDQSSSCESESEEQVSVQLETIQQVETKQPDAVKTELATCSSVVRTMITNMQDQSESKLGTVYVMDCSRVDHLDLDRLEECLTELDLPYVNKLQYEYGCHVPRPANMNAFIEAARTRGWLSDILVFDLTRRAQLRAWEVVMLNKLALDYPATRVWLLTKHLPKIPTWKMYSVGVECSVKLLGA
ncbi:Hypothetical protein POVR2_LOCUS242 [uncultured virus]|nr:Hypothetical protein POVR2_LOCUS242 [uncultured virus]